jgi:hypothetical protein
MSKTIKVQGKSVAMPPQCVVCLQPAANTYKIERSFSYGNSTVLVNVPVPLCGTHHAQAAAKSPAEKTAAKIGLIAGAVIGLVSAAGLLAYWASSGQGSLVLNIFLALVLGAGFFLIVWLATAFWLAPSFANPESKKARQAVRIMAYWPRDEVMQLEFENETAADLVAGMNGGTR